MKMPKENNILSPFEIQKKLIDKGVNVSTLTAEKHQIWESIIIKSQKLLQWF